MPLLLTPAPDMLEQAEYRFRKSGITNIKILQGDVSELPFEDGTFDLVLCMNGLHVFPDKDKAYSVIFRALKPGGKLLACFYIAGEKKVADLLAKTLMTRMGWFTPPFDTASSLRQRLIPYYDILDFHVEGAMIYFRAAKKQTDSQLTLWLSISVDELYNYENRQKSLSRLIADYSLF